MHYMYLLYLINTPRNNCIGIIAGIIIIKDFK